MVIGRARQRRYGRRGSVGVARVLGTTPVPAQLKLVVQAIAAILAINLVYYDNLLTAIRVRDNRLKLVRWGWGARSVGVPARL